MSKMPDRNEIEEVIENVNGTAIKYADGRMKCYGNFTITNVNCNTAYGNIFIEETGTRNMNFPAPFKDSSYTINLYLKNPSGGVGGVCGSSANVVNGCSYYIWNAASYNFGSARPIEISYEAMGKWK